MSRTQHLEAQLPSLETQFGQLEVNEARRLKELERENGELKKMLAESLLKNRVLELVCKKRSPERSRLIRSLSKGCFPHNCQEIVVSCGYRIFETALSPVHRRDWAHKVVASGICSGRAACRILRLARSTYWYRERPLYSVQEQLRKRLPELSEAYPRYGYRRIAVLLRQEGWRVGKRQVQRLRRAEGLRVPPTKRKVVRRGVSTGWPVKATHRGHVWTWDFIADAAVRGGALKMLTILDEYSGSS